ncbi:MAG: hypothetical protein LBH45_03900 [Campylobacteraceae bacterium]|nr:hypothetical protein [Campylobacteraceae bacterium]
MKKLILLLSLALSSLLSQSIYPLKFSFDDSGFYVEDIMFKSWRFENSTTQDLGIFLTDANDNVLILGNHTFLSICKNIKTLEELYNYKNIYKDELSSKCHYMADIFTDNNTKTIVYENMIMLVSEDYINNNYYHDTQYSVLIFENKNYLGKIGLILHSKDKLYEILRSIKPNKNIKSIDEYIDIAKESMNKSLTNTAFKNIASAMLLDTNHEDIKPLLQQINIEKELFFTKKAIEELGVNEKNR